MSFDFPVEDVESVEDVPFSSIAEEIGKSIEVIDKELFEKNEKFKDVEIKLDGRQKLNIKVLARGLFVDNRSLTAQAIWDLWPVGLNTNGKVSPAITSPTERGRIFSAGSRPSIPVIQAYCATEEYRAGMATLGIEIDPSDTGLTAEQLGLLTILSNPADGRDLKRKLSHSGVSWNKYQVWLKQPIFAKMHSDMMTTLLKDMMPIAKQQIAAKIAAGDTAMIKFGMEVTGEHDPSTKKQIDAKAFIGILLEIIEEEVKDPAILQRIGAKISFRGSKALDP